MGPALREAYREYLEGQYQESSDLEQVDLFSVPFEVDLESPTLAEWCNLG